MAGGSAAGATTWTAASELIHLRNKRPETFSLWGVYDTLSPYTDLLLKWQSTFHSLQSFRSGAGAVMESGTRSALVHASMEYIAQLAAYRDQAQDPVLQSRIRQCESLMMLAHAVFILPHQSVSRQVVKWASFHNAAGSGPVRGSLWKSVHKYILGGYITQAIHLIKGQQTDPNAELECNFISLLESIPLLDPKNTCLTCSQFDEVFDLYRLRCAQFVSMLGPEHRSELLPIAKTLQGDVAVIVESVQDLSPDNWLYCLSALLLFSNPTATKSDLPDMVAISLQTQRSEIAHQDCVVAMLSGDVSCALVALYSQLPISWLVAHLTDLFHLCGYTISNMIGKESLRIRLTFEYGSALLSDVNLWHIAPSYLMACGNSGLQLLRSGLLYHVHDEFSAEKVIDLCQRLQLNDEIVAVCKEMSSRSLSRSCPESAVLYQLRASDPCAASDIVDVMVSEFVQNRGQTRYSSFILEELIAAWRDPPTSLLSLCIAVQIMETRDLRQRLRAAVKFIRRGDVHNGRLDEVVALEANRIFQSWDDDVIRLELSVDDIKMLMTLAHSDASSTGPELSRSLANLILQQSTPPAVITSQ